jgi:hypothetical protein
VNEFLPAKLAGRVERLVLGIEPLNKVCGLRDPIRNLAESPRHNSCRQRQEDKDPQQAEPLEWELRDAFQVGYNAFEFLLDLGQVAPESEKIYSTQESLLVRLTAKPCTRPSASPSLAMSELSRRSQGEMNRASSRTE